MAKQSTEGTGASRVQWENLEAWVLGHVQGFIQQILAEEVSVFLERQKSQRQRPLSVRGHGKPRRLNLELWHDHGAAAPGPRRGAAL